MPKHYRERIQPLGMISATVSDDGMNADLDIGISGRIYCLNRSTRAALRRPLDRIDPPEQMSAWYPLDAPAAAGAAFADREATP